MAYLDQFLQIVVRQDASDLHIAEGEPPKIRVHGDITPIRAEPISHDEARRMLSEVSGPRNWELLSNTGISILPIRWMSTLDFAPTTSSSPKGTPRHFD